ncbi:hypothetical protein Prum_090860 [Phytohabitans rumicis]|uniref:Uncharacterized protein n=1 Tax=Phytohabitans rumicis TaxID=1076125 RepID=A0A6V8LGR1_9ACTN|nr:hypothetical protein Prum_090860 [Phytohabitans rumicis]
MTSYEETRHRQFALAGTRLLTVLPLTTSGDHQGRSGYNPFCLCGWPPCSCPDNGPIIWIPDDDVIDSQPVRGGERGEDHREIVVRRGSRVLVETLEELPLEELVSPSRLARRSSIPYNNFYGYYAIWDSTVGAFVGSIHFTASQAAMEAAHIAGDGAGHHLAVVHVH